MTQTPELLCEVRGHVGFITLNRPKALNALSLGMVRGLLAQLLAWRDDADVLAVAVRGSHKEGVFGHFCAGGDIRFLHQAVQDGNPQVEDFFTEEYTLNHLIFTYPKPYIAFMDGVVMGGGMGISQGASLRIVTEKSKLAMPEALIGLFPDVGGGYFLSRCPGHVGEWLGLAGESLAASEAIAFGLADAYLPAAEQAALWDALGTQGFADGAAAQAFVQSRTQPQGPQAVRDTAAIDRVFALPTVQAIIDTLEAEAASASDSAEWAQQTAAALRKRSPLLLHVVLEQIRRARGMSMAEDLRMERDLVRNCFFQRLGQSETVEGIRALAIDKDQSPRWNPPRIEDVAEADWQAFFTSPWPAHSHPLAALKD
ncbi:enoyl-CoA hydratase/isomerase family protein [Comamonas nitrativorans]|uniref:Enoyl-CoA hydratase/isomerase family protein n=1 Tax=Comamonas nitrativorans TaxID=108437 RepID=A0ABV9GUU1_9BURK